MKSSLPTLTRIQKFKIDEQRKILNEHLNKEEELMTQMKRLLQEYEREKDFSRTHNNVGDFGAYTKRYLQFKEYLEQALEDIRAKIAEVRDIIADMFKEQKTFEIVNNNRKEHENKENDLKDQKMLDEIGTNAYIKRNKKSETPL